MNKKRILITGTSLCLISVILISCFNGANAENSSGNNKKILGTAGNEEVQGKILSQDEYVTVVKVWGSHQERGYAYGYLLGDKILDAYNGYIRKVFGEYILKAKEIIKSGKFFKIDKKYVDECKAVVEGIKAAGYETDGFDYLDLLVINTFLDIQAVGSHFVSKNGCSSLMAWGAATMETDLKGKSIITRNLDWSVAQSLVKNNLVVIHIPSEHDEQPWAAIGYTGLLGALSGTNQSGLSIFQHVLDDDFNNITLSKYEPVWYSVRKALEQKDYDGSGQNDVQDLKEIIKENKGGYADGYILTAMAPSIVGADSLIALVAELGPSKPYYSFRSNLYEDKFEGQTLYAANSPICRNNRRQYCKRYNNTYKDITGEPGIGADKFWKIMTSSSCLKGINLQTMQVIPELGILKLAVWQNEKGAYSNEAKTYNLNEFFKPVK